MQIKRLLKFWWVGLIAVALIGGGVTLAVQSRGAATAASKQVTKTKSKQPTIDWQRPSESKPYPTPANFKKFNVLVSTTKHRVYLRDNTKVLYTMYASTGKDDSTPKGKFAVEDERGQFFYNAQSKEGAHYWTSFKDHGIYLFHTVPTDKAGHYIPAEAKALGHSANSHGCVRLSIPDARYIFFHVKAGTPVTVV